MSERMFGPYRLDAPLERGGPGEGYRAYHTGQDRVVELRLLPEALTAEAALRERFHRECRAVASVPDSRLIPVDDFGEIDGRLFVVMPLVEGVNLATVIERDGPIQPVRALRILSGVAYALDSAQADGLVHRDVRASSVRLIGSGFGAVVRLSRLGMVAALAAIGPPAYSAPELLHGEPIDGRAAVYSLACLLYEMLTGEKPFVGQDGVAVPDQHLTAPPPRPSAVSPRLALFDDVVARGMAKTAENRYSTAGELADAARRAHRGDSGAAPVTGLAPGAPRPRFDGAPPPGALPGDSDGPPPPPKSRPWAISRGVLRSAKPPPRKSTIEDAPSLPAAILERRVGIVVANSVGTPLTGSLAPATTYLLRLGIGVDLVGDVLRAAVPIPSELVPPSTEEGHWLTVSVRGEGVDFVPGPHPIFLPNRGAAWVCPCRPEQSHSCGPDSRWDTLDLPFLAPRRPGNYRVLVSIYCRATVLQTAQLTLPVEPVDTASEQRPSAMLTYSLGADLGEPAARATRTMSILSEPAAEGNHRLHVNGDWHGPPIVFEFPDAAAGESARHLRTLLFETQLQPSGTGWTSRYRADLSTDPATYTADLHRLAVAGSEVFVGAFGGKGGRLRDALAASSIRGGNAAVVQIARAMNTRLTMPWQLVYDEPIDDAREPIICPSVAEFGPEAGDGPVPAGCPHRERHDPRRGTLCPFGFWGLAHQLECPPPTFGRQLPERTGTQPPATLTVAVHPDLAAAGWTRHSRALRALDASGTVLADLELLRRSVLAGTDVLYFYCHGVRVERPGSAAPRAVLDLGRGGRLSPLTLNTWVSGDPPVRWDSRRPLVVLNGCHTGEALPDTPADLVAAFVDNVGAAGVIATEIAVDSALAAAAMELFLDRLFAGLPVGLAIRAMRWGLLARGNVIGLAYSPYCDARLSLPRLSGSA